MHAFCTRCFRAAKSLQQIHRGTWRDRVTTPHRCLTINEMATALRPFYFVVHPDLFGQHPQERAVNEDSLKRLQEYLASLQKSGKATPTELVFFVRPQNKQGLDSVHIHLNSDSLRSTIISVLSSVHLPLSYVHNIPRKRYKPVEIRWDPTYYHMTGKRNPDKEFYKRKKDRTLLDWLQNNSSKATANRVSSQRTQTELAILEDKLIADIGLKGLVWQNDWSVMQCLACLKSFQRLFEEHPSTSRHALKDKMLVFSKKTGVSHRGDVVLSMEEVPTDWLRLLSLVDAYTGMVDRLPSMESKLSGLLANIRVVRHSAQEIIMAEEYELLLNKILNTLRRSQEEVNEYLCKEDLSHLQLIVEGGAAPLTLSSRGQFLVPATMPGTIIVKFIAENKEEAFNCLQDMELLMKMENVVKEQCKERLQLSSIQSGEHVTPKQMTSCCERLIEDAVYLELALSGGRLHISSYYAVMQDGDVYIPWNWKSDIS